jgi:hypothetical protein
MAHTKQVFNFIPTLEKGIDRGNGSQLQEVGAVAQAHC